jgi:hypothetical protein
MAETNSRQAAKNALGTKNLNADAGRVRTLVIETPAVFSQLAIDDTLAGGVYVPAGCRVLGARVQNAAGTASSTINIGLRKRKDGTVLSATAIASLIAITTATTNPTAASNGAYLAAGVAAQILSDDAEVYITAKGAVLAANQALRVEVDYVGA